MTVQSDAAQRFLSSLLELSVAVLRGGGGRLRMKQQKTHLQGETLLDCDK